LSESTNPVIVIETAQGSITVELLADKAPKTVENFLAHVDSEYYDGTIFHRVISQFMIQGGGMDADMSKKSARDPISNEAKNGEKNLRGTLAMARTGEVDSATSQFFVNLKDNDFLNNSSRDYGYTVFGKVTDGMDVVDAIAAVPTGMTAGHQDVPVEPVMIIDVKSE
jgi:cyclophilin family peptidyl-prolyl cis-trans isomerase